MDANIKIMRQQSLEEARKGAYSTQANCSKTKRAAAKTIFEEHGEKDEKAFCSAKRPTGCRS